MIRKFIVLMTFLGATCLGGCSLSPDQRVAREQSLKQAAENFINSASQANWNDIYRMSDGSFESADKLKDSLVKSWVQDATLTGGVIASMAWVTDNIAKIKINWAFQAGSVQSFSSETFIWGWDGNGWKYKGRALR
jgi:hypothetical protein